MGGTQGAVRDGDAAAALVVAIVGAGLSGICAACRLAISRPQDRVRVFEARAAMGGTWDLFRYPGVRSDSDMHTLGYGFRPWRGAAIADGPSILAYIRETAAAHGIGEKIAYGAAVRAADWSREDALWTLTLEDAGGGETRRARARFVFFCTGYYDYDAGHAPDLPGRAPGALKRLQSPNALRDVAATSIGSQFLCNRRPICKCCNQLKDDADRLQIGSFSLTYFAARNGAEFDLTPEQIYEALRAGSTARVWADVDPALPRTAIRFYAPGAGALETEIFKQLTVRQGCEAVTGAPCGEIALRADGAYVEADDDAALAARLLADPTAIGVGDFSERGRFESRGLRSLAPAQEPGAFELLIESR
ncbi:MAG: NAD(P)/FAD-dependent oxidoreductase [Pseudomonadota bacterium]